MSHLLVCFVVRVHCSTPCHQTSDKSSCTYKVGGRWHARKARLWPFCSEFTTKCFRLSWHFVVYMLHCACQKSQLLRPQARLHQDANFFLQQTKAATRVASSVFLRPPTLLIFISVTGTDMLRFLFTLVLLFWSNYTNVLFEICKHLFLNTPSVRNY